MKRLAVSVCSLGLLGMTMAGCVTRVVERQEPASQPAATVVTTPSSTTVVTTTPAAPVPAPACAGAWSSAGGTNFGSCGK